MKRWIWAVAMGLCGCLMLSLCGFTATCEDIAGRVLRLHVIAASDSAEDQAIKLQVRDAILAETAGLLDGVTEREEAQARLTAALPRITDAGDRCLQELGSDDTVTAELCTMYFTTRQYDTVTLPAGEYEALRVTIGEGNGQNWWCVVFPPMCLSGACDTALDDVLTADETEVVTDAAQYRVRLKVVEWYYALKEKWQ